MKEKKGIETATFRYGIISPVIHDTRGDQKKYFQEMALKSFHVPGVGMRQYKWATFKHWLKVYRKSGIEGLMPVQRNDKGVSRRIDTQLAEAITLVKTENPHLSCNNLYRLLVEQNRLPHPPISVGTLRSFLKAKGLDGKKKESVPRKKYELPFVNDLWVADFMHGPKGLFDKGGKVYLFAIIDDHTRMIVGCQFFMQENTLAIEAVFKKAVLTYGLPKKFYCDNGAPFSSHHLKWACAKMVVSLIHSKPYDSPSRGKIERFFRTFRAKFLNPLPRHEVHSLKHLNELLRTWIDNDYNRFYHGGIHSEPLTRYMEGIKKISLRTITDQELDLCFFQTIRRNVKKDSTVSINNSLYEVPQKYIGSTVELRFPGANPHDLTIYEENKPVCVIKPVDVHKNAEDPLGIKFSQPKDEEDDI